MSDEGERTCPLCAEEMDLTDQQLKPCKCGYDICVWCWHHIIDMAEKDETEGRCPACRVPYDKEKIVGTTAKCERLVAEVSSERKVKSQKMKMKTSEGRKQLSSVRVIQRNLVYIVGLPLNLADEDLLQQKEYFGQYGKVLKVSMSRTATGAIQQFPNNTCSVYITYPKEEDAIRCIQCVHGFILDGRSLRACFGTTKYCHAWLRNAACTNPDCLYLHEVGSQEDSFTKDEIVSAFARVQVTGSTNNQQRRSGSILPPPVDEYCNSSSASTAKPIIISASNTTSAIARGSPPHISSGSLPAAASWGMRSLNCQPQAASSGGLEGPAKPKSDVNGALMAVSMSVGSKAQALVCPSDVGKKPTLHEESHITLGKYKSESLKSCTHVSVDDQTNLSEISTTPDGGAASVTSSDQQSSLPILKDSGRGTGRNTFNYSEQTSSLGTEKSENIATDEKTKNLSSYMPSMNGDRNTRIEHSGVSRSNSFTDNGSAIPSSQGSLHFTREPLTSSGTSESVPAKSAASNGVCVSAKQLDWRSDSNTRVSKPSNELEEDILSFDSQRLEDPEVENHSTYLPDSSNLIHRSHYLQPSEASGTVNLNTDPIFVGKDRTDRQLLYTSSVSAISNGHLGYQENFASAAAAASQDRMAEHSVFHPTDRNGMQINGSSSFIGTPVDKGESSIISNILAMDFDVWGDSLTSPQTLAKLLGDSDTQSGSLKLSSLWKAQNSSQSRFSFARQEESRNEIFDGIGKLNRNVSVNHDFADRDPFFDKTGMGYGFSCNKSATDLNVASNNYAFSSNKLSAVSRGQVSAPPGFSVPSRAPPPGFSSQERMDQAFGTFSGKHLLDTSILMNSYSAPPTENVGSTTGDIEFMDPAIMAVGKGRLQGGLNNAGLDMRSSFNHLSAFENEARLRLLMQQSVSQQQNLRYPDVGDTYSLNDSYRMSTRLMDQSHANTLSHPQLSIQQQSRNAFMSNGHWDGWNEVQSGNNLGVAELLRNERLGFNKFHNGYEDSKFRMPTSDKKNDLLLHSSRFLKVRLISWFDGLSDEGSNSRNVVFWKPAD